MLAEQHLPVDDGKRQLKKDTTWALHWCQIQQYDNALQEGTASIFDAVSHNNKPGRAWFVHQCKKVESLQPHQQQRVKQLIHLKNLHEIRWRTQFDLVEGYMAKHGGHQVPVDYIAPDGMKLGQWVSKQRKLQKKGQLAKERVQLLESIGFHWSPKDVDWLFYVRKHLQKSGNNSIPVAAFDMDGNGKKVLYGRWAYRERRAIENGTSKLDQLLQQELIALLSIQVKEQRPSASIKKKTKKRNHFSHNSEERKIFKKKKTIQPSPQSTTMLQQIRQPPLLGNNATIHMEPTTNGNKLPDKSKPPTPPNINTTNGDLTKFFPKETMPIVTPNNMTPNAAPMAMIYPAIARQILHIPNRQPPGEPSIVEKNSTLSPHHNDTTDTATTNSSQSMTSISDASNASSKSKQDINATTIHISTANAKTKNPLTSTDESVENESSQGINAKNPSTFITTKPLATNGIVEVAVTTSPQQNDAQMISSSTGSANAKTNPAGSPPKNTSNSVITPIVNDTNCANCQHDQRRQTADPIATLRQHRPPPSSNNQDAQCQNAATTNPLKTRGPPSALATSQSKSIFPADTNPTTRIRLKTTKPLSPMATTPSNQVTPADTTPTTTISLKTSMGPPPNTVTTPSNPVTPADNMTTTSSLKITVASPPTATSPGTGPNQSLISTAATQKASQPLALGMKNVATKTAPHTTQKPQTDTKATCTVLHGAARNREQPPPLVNQNDLADAMTLLSLAKIMESNVAIQQKASTEYASVVPLGMESKCDEEPLQQANLYLLSDVMSPLNEEKHMKSIVATGHNVATSPGRRLTRSNDSKPHKSTGHALATTQSKTISKPRGRTEQSRSKNTTPNKTTEPPLQGSKSKPRANIRKTRSKNTKQNDSMKPPTQATKTLREYRTSSETKGYTPKSLRPQPAFLEDSNTSATKCTERHSEVEYAEITDFAEKTIIPQCLCSIKPVRNLQHTVKPIILRGSGSSITDQIREQVMKLVELTLKLPAEQQKEVEKMCSSKSTLLYTLVGREETGRKRPTYTNVIACAIMYQVTLDYKDNPEKWKAKLPKTFALAYLCVERLFQDKRVGSWFLERVQDNVQDGMGGDLILLHLAETSDSDGNPIIVSKLKRFYERKGLNYCPCPEHIIQCPYCEDCKRLELEQKFFQVKCLTKSGQKFLDSWERRFLEKEKNEGCFIKLPIF